MKNWWIKFGCFLTTYNYQILSNCSEVSVKKMKRNASGMYIVCILWFLIGYFLAKNYIKLGVIGALICAMICCILVIQIERQVISAAKKNAFLFLFRAIMAIVMAIIGSIILDQMIFQDDIKVASLKVTQKAINEELRSETAELVSQIKDLDATIIDKEQKRNRLNEEIYRNPSILTKTVQINTSSQLTPQYDSSNNTVLQVKHPTTNRKTTITPQDNPRKIEVNELTTEIASLTKEKSQKQDSLLTVRPRVRSKIEANRGFLQELEIMHGILTNSKEAKQFWYLWIVLFIGMELFILMNKIFEEETDYDFTIKHHMDLQKRKLDLLKSTYSQPTT